MLRIAIVEDNEAERAHLRKCIDFWADTEKIEVQADEYPSGLAFIGKYEPVYDIVLMDIDMPGMNGMDTARSLRRMDTAVILIFVTNMAQYAIQGYEVSAANYILKPVSRQDFRLKMSRVMPRLTRRSDAAVSIGTSQDLRTLRLSVIRYIEVKGHYLLYHTGEGDFEEYGTLKSAEEKLASRDFCRCNRFLLVNLRYVTAVEGDTAVVGGSRLPISRPQKKQFLSALSSFIGGVSHA
ncbi:MAG: response regulator transcription factor [Lachnospiraceae bacterium]|nr:response regulator transcription factor [Lachnospiraceae bacterium]